MKQIPLLLKMKQNIEIKAKAKNFPKQKKLARNLSETKGQILIQEDTFFVVPEGKLKLRKFSENRGELISYKRADKTEARKSSYQIFSTDNPDLLKNTLSLNLEILGIIKKTRHLYFFDKTRIHFDEVKELGHFIEFEYVLDENENFERGREMIKFLQNQLQIQSKDLISRAYIDLLLSRR